VFDRTIEQFQEGVDYLRVPYPVWSQWDSEKDNESLSSGGGYKGDRIVLTESGTDGGPNSSSRRGRGELRPRVRGFGDVVAVARRCAFLLPIGVVRGN
jgi:hypothetical protein